MLTPALPLTGITGVEPSDYGFEYVPPALEASGGPP
jgi:hypothetical protein